jgi:superfamily II RNA helicase
MTGDIKFAPQSDIVVLTTEILRNLLYKQGSVTETLGITANLSLDDVDAIVFDEVHYINDPERGRVWEECFILLPPHIRLVLLSATLERPEAFADWLTELKGVKMNLISTTYRVVPLYHKVGNELLMGHDNKFNKSVYTTYLRDLKNQDDALRKHKEAVKSRESDQVVKRDVRAHSFLHRMNEHIEMLDRENLLPALFFVFSRKQCVLYASKVTHQLIDASDSSAIQHILNFHLHRYPELKTLPQYHELEQLLLKGVAYHHSGLLPLLKEIVEILFGRGLLKVLFATETFAVGINMPTKTVVFTSYRKYDDQCEGMRILRTDEYIQMAGRAGRRGKDDKGIVYYLPDREPESATDVQYMMTGRQASITSRMNFGYEFILKSMLSGRLEWIDILKKSYWYVLVQEDLVRIKNEREALIAGLPEFEPDCEERWNLEETFKTAINGPKKDAQRKLEAWKNKHPGPNWEASWKNYIARKAGDSKIAVLDADIQLALEVTWPVIDRIGYLTQHGYIKDGKLTKLGTMAAEINEGDPLDMSRRYLDKSFHELPINELVCNLAMYVEHKKDEPLEEPVYDWLEGKDFGVICQEYGLDAGTFMKTILKVANVLEEWTTLATFCEDLEMLEKLRGVKERLVRGIVVPDSLYLRG